MAHPNVNEARSPAELFAEFLDWQEAEPALSFERWVAGQSSHVAELRGLHEAYVRLQPHLPTSDSGGRAASSVSVSLERGYDLFEELGRGGFGRVQRARDRVLGREVALKVLGEQARVSPQMRRLFLQEARVLARLDHPNIVRIHSIESEGGEIRLSLELVVGRTLHAIVEEDGPLSAEEAARIGIDLCRALAAIHGQGLVHMDIKPGNVMRAEGGRIVLLDFGFARPTAEGGSEGGSPLGGTPPFMSPEHFEGRTDIGPRSDVYSLGVLLYWLVTGRYPYEFTSPVDLGVKVLAGRVRPLLDVRSDVPAELVEIVERAMARKEGERFPSAGAMEEALRRFVGGQPAAGPEQGGRRVPARRTIVVAGVAVVVVGAMWLLLGPLARDPFEMEYHFSKLSGGESVPLASGDSVKVGDEIHLEARSSEAFYLYVFTQDERGHWARLVPAGDNAALHEKDVRHRFPAQNGWKVFIEGDTEHLYVIASPERVAFGEELVTQINPGGRDQNDLTRGERERLRGISGVTAPPSVDAYFDLEAHFTGFEERLDDSDRVYVAHHELRNEGR